MTVVDFCWGAVSTQGGGTAILYNHMERILYGITDRGFLSKYS